MKKKLKKYDNGGEAGNFLKNMIYGGADATLSTIGLSNVIGDDKYQGAGSEFFKGYANTMGTIGKTALPMAGQLVGIPAPVTSAALNGISQFNPQASQPQINQKANMINAGMQYPNGGVIGGPNAELEKEENTLNPDGSTNQYDGPSHNQGGIPTQLDPGTLIFSDKLKDKETKKTFAELNKKNNTDKEEEIIEEGHGYSVKSAELMKKAKNMKSMNLYTKQEQMKLSKLSNYAKKLGINAGTFRNGGMVKYEDGGIKDDENTVVPGAANTGFNINYGNPYEKVGVQPYDEGSVKQAAWNKSLENGQLTNEERDHLLSSSVQKNTNTNQIAGQLGYAALNNAGNIYDLSRSNNIETRSFNRITPNLLDPSEDLRYNDRVYNAQEKNIRSASGGDASTYLQNMRSNTLSRTMANSRINMGYANQNAGIKNSIAQYNANAGDRETMANAQIRANQRNLQSQAIGQIGQNTAMQMRDNKANSQQDAYLKMLVQMYPQFADMAKTI